jgi:hypothetical protein
MGGSGTIITTQEESRPEAYIIQWQEICVSSTTVEWSPCDGEGPVLVLLGPCAGPPWKLRSISKHSLHVGNEKIKLQLKPWQNLKIKLQLKPWQNLNSSSCIHTSSMAESDSKLSTISNQLGFRV